MSGEERVILEGIEPFNKFWFRSCYYHHLIAAYRYFGVDENVLLSNYYDVYRFDGAGRLFWETRALLEGAALQSATGVAETVYHRVDDVVSLSEEAIRSGKLVIAAADTFCLPYREGSFRKEHMMHYLLLNGFDTAAQSFDCWDHLYTNSYRFLPGTVSFGALREAFDAYVKNFGEENGRLAVAVGRSGPPAAEPCREYAARLAASYRENRGIFRHNYEQLTEYLRFVRGLAAAMDERALCFEELGKTFGQINNKLQTERNYLFRFFGRRKLVAAVESLRAEYMLLHSLSHKIVFTKLFDRAVSEKYCARIDRILILERECLAAREAFR